MHIFHDVNASESVFYADAFLTVQGGDNGSSTIFIGPGATISMQLPFDYSLDEATGLLTAPLEQGSTWLAVDPQK